MDYALLATLTLALATLATVHVYLAARLTVRQEPRWRGVLAFFVPPLAPIWAFRAGWRVPAGIWVAAVVAYTVARLLA